MENCRNIMYIMITNQSLMKVHTIRQMPCSKQGKKSMHTVQSLRTVYLQEKYTAKNAKPRTDTNPIQTTGFAEHTIRIQTNVRQCL